MDVFKSTPLGKIEFKDEPKKPALDITPSLSLDTLIEHNDDLMIKLKTALRRLANIETEFTNVSEENLKYKSALAQLQDQIYVFKEDKENYTKQAEKDRYLIQSLQQEITVLRLQVQRFQKYHEKVKTQVKPYIQELKVFASRLESDKSELTNQKHAVEKELAQKQSQVEDLRHQMRDLIKNAQSEMEEQSRKFEAMVNYFETELKTREKFYAEQREQMSDLEVKTQMLAKIKQSRDLLENHMIELEKSKDDLRDGYAKEIKDLKNQIEFLHQEKSRLDIDLKDTKAKQQQFAKEKSTLEIKNREMTAQVDSLRTLWNEQQIEVEKLRKSQEALERLNLELSQKLASQSR